jgi:hypothetical protein
MSESDNGPKLTRPAPCGSHANQTGPPAPERNMDSQFFLHRQHGSMPNLQYAWVPPSSLSRLLQAAIWINRRAANE